MVAPTSRTIPPRQKGSARTPLSSILLPSVLTVVLTGMCLLYILAMDLSFNRSLNVISFTEGSALVQKMLETERFHDVGVNERVRSDEQTSSLLVTFNESLFQPSINKKHAEIRKIDALSMPLETSFYRLQEMRKDPQLVGRNAIDINLKQTTAGVDISDPNIYQAGIDYHGDSSTATVMGMATGYSLKVYQRFVGSLRKSGFQGHIILGVSPDVSSEVLDYFAFRNVTPKILKLSPCTFKNNTECAEPYLDIKTRWSRFPLQRDWLESCPTCTGPILTMDVRDAFFQQDPFGLGSPVVHGLQLFEEHMTQRTTHWLTDVPFRKCKGIRLDQVMLCSGTTVGTRVAMMKYFDVMYGEMKRWSFDKDCQFEFHGDDQSIHNYLYYSGQLPFATTWPNRAGGIVHTVGKQASDIQKEHTKKLQKAYPGFSKIQASKKPFPGASADGKHLLGVKEYNLTDHDGWFTEFDGSRSRVVHQWDRFGPTIDSWMNQKGISNDPFPPPKSS